MVQTKAEKAAYNKAYRLKNKEKINVQRREWYANNAETYLENQKIYNKNNKDKIQARMAQYYKDNKEHLLQRQNEYNSENREMILKKAKEYSKRPEVIERQRIYALTKDVKVKGWIKKGLLDDVDMVWDRYCNTEFCDDCRCQLIHEGPICSARKCMDHSHKTGKFRNILCHSCNMDPSRREININNVSGHKYIHKKNTKDGIRWSYNGSKLFKSKIDALCYKYIKILMNAANQRSGQNCHA
jgi:hypothetical protein